MGNNICKTLTNTYQLQIQLLHPYYQKYKLHPYQYIIDQFKSQQFILTQQSHLINFFIQLSQYYHSIPYHNITHAFDVMLAIDKYIIQYKMMERLGLTQEKRFYILVAAYAHDNGHQGYTNGFYINSDAPLAIKYSYLSPLENMHSSNLLQCLTRNHVQVSKQMKQLMTMLILATDNKHHFQLLEEMKLLSTELQNNHEIFLNKKQTVLKMMIHTADINSCGKTLEEYLKWNQRLYQQFQEQYKQERKQKLKQFSFDFDINNMQMSVIKSNLGFFQHMVLPFFKQVHQIIPQFSMQYSNALKLKEYFEQSKTKLEQKKTVIKLKKN